MPLLVFEFLYLLLDRLWGPQDGFFGFSSGGYLEGGDSALVSLLFLSVPVSFFLARGLSTDNDIIQDEEEINGVTLILISMITMD